MNRPKRTLLTGWCNYNCQNYSTSKGPVPMSYKKLRIWATFAPTPSQKTQSRSSPLRSNPNFECCERMLRGSPESVDALWKHQKIYGRYLNNYSFAICNWYFTYYVFYVPGYGSRRASKNGTRKKTNKNVIRLTNKIFGDFLAIILHKVSPWFKNIAPSHFVTELCLVEIMVIFQ